jgi:hypothetical protein
VWPNIGEAYRNGKVRQFSRASAAIFLDFFFGDTRNRSGKRLAGLDVGESNVGGNNGSCR